MGDMNRGSLPMPSRNPTMNQSGQVPTPTPSQGAGRQPDMSSMLNPNDMAKKLAYGDVKQGMTVTDLLGQIGVSPTDPVEKLISALKNQSLNSTMSGKMANFPGQPGATPGQGQSNSMPPQSGSPQDQPGLSGILNKLQRS